MDYLHALSVPATKSELDLFKVPATQTVIDTYYEVEYRPNASLDSSSTYTIEVPESDDFTDLAGSMVYVSFSIKKNGSVDIQATDKVKAVYGFAHALFDQFDIYLNNVNICQANSLHHYEAYLQDVLYGHPSKLDYTKMMISENENEKSAKKQSDLYFRISSPLSTQNNLLLNNIKLTFNLKRSNSSRGLLSTEATNYFVKIHDLAIIIKRVKIFPDVSLAIQNGLEKADAKYFITKNDTKNFVLPKGLSSYTFENVFTGILPKRFFVGFLSTDSYNSLATAGPYNFANHGLNFIVSHVNGMLVPTQPYTPDFSNDRYVREFYSLYRYTNQDEGIPQLNVSYDEYKNNFCLYAFDLSPDSTLAAESGILSLVKPGNIKIEVKFKNALAKPLHMLVMGQYDNLIQIDKFRNIKLDY